VIRFLTSAAFRTDAFLHSHSGRKYGALLTFGLIADIGQRVVGAPKQIASRQHLVGTALAVVLECGLLIHQVAEMYERLGADTSTEATSGICGRSGHSLIFPRKSGRG
jgi:hypothetical protein